MVRTSQEDLNKSIKKTLKKVSVGSKYFHYKNPKDCYVVEFVGVLENTEEVCVGYRALYGNGLLWVRPLSDFLAKKEVDGKLVSRFTRV